MPLAAPEPPLLNVTALATWFAVVAVVAVEALPLNVAVMVPALKLPEASRATMALAVFALVALDVTVKVELPDWFAVNEAEPDKPVPDTFIVSVPLLTVVGVCQDGAADAPPLVNTCPDVP